MDFSFQSMQTSEKDLVRIHQNAVRILSELGVAVGSSKMCERLSGIGCRISKDRVYIPPEIIDKTIKAIPRSFKLYDRSGKSFVTVDADGPSLCTNVGILPYIYDIESGSLRRPLRKDVELTTLIIDALPEIDIIYVSLVDATEVPAHMMTLIDFAEVISNTTKPMVGPGITNRNEAKAIIDMASTLRNENSEELMLKPPCAPFIVVNSPLSYPEETVDALEEIVLAGLPMMFCSNPVMGATAPYAIAATVALGHAEVLAAAVMAHAVRPGLPVVNFNTPTIAEMQSLLSVSNPPENGMLRSLITKLSQYLGIPVYEHCDTSSSRLDEQASDEKSINAMIIGDARPSLFGGAGGLANAACASYEALILDNERFGAIRRFLKGIVIDDDSLAYHVIEDMVKGKSVVMHEHTLKNIRGDEVWQSQLSQRKGIVGGKPMEFSIKELARKEIKNIFKNHKVEQLPKDIKNKIDEILMRYDSKVSGSSRC